MYGAVLLQALQVSRGVLPPLDSARLRLVHGTS